MKTDAVMDLTQGGQGVFGNPYTIDMWQMLTITMQSTTYMSNANDPHSYHRCNVYTTLHYSDSQLTPVSTTHHRFDNNLNTEDQVYSTKLKIQWDYGPFDGFFVVRKQVIYDVSGKNIVVNTDEQRVYVKVSNPCLVANGGAIVPKAISDINYWIKDSTSSTGVTTFHDYPTDRDGGQTYLFTN